MKFVFVFVVCIVTGLCFLCHLRRKRVFPLNSDYYLGGYAAFFGSIFSRKDITFYGINCVKSELRNSFVYFFCVICCWVGCGLYIEHNTLEFLSINMSV